jgi:hypothetical protein
MKPKSSTKKMQQVSFSTIAECLDFLPPDELKLTEFLRGLIFECVPEVEERLSFNVPYYFRNAGLFFIWPGSIGWGKKTYPGVRFGFQSGYLIPDEIGYLDKGGRKQVYWRDFHSLAEIDVELLKSYIFEAVIVDDQKPIRKRSLR